MKRCCLGFTSVVWYISVFPVSSCYVVIWNLSQPSILCWLLVAFLRQFRTFTWMRRGVPTSCYQPSWMMAFVTRPGSYLATRSMPPIRRPLRDGIDGFLWASSLVTCTPFQLLGSKSCDFRSGMGQGSCGNPGDLVDCGRMMSKWASRR